MGIPLNIPWRVDFLIRCFGAISPKVFCFQTHPADDRAGLLATTCQEIVAGIECEPLQHPSRFLLRRCYENHRKTQSNVAASHNNAGNNRATRANAISNATTDEACPKNR